MSSVNKNHEFVEFVEKNCRFFDPTFVANLKEGKYAEVEINSDEDHFRFDLKESTVTVNRSEEHDIDNFNFNNLRLQLQEQEVFEGLLPVIRVKEEPQRQAPKAVAAKSKTPSNAEKWQNEVDRFLSKIMPDGDYKGCISSFSLPITEDGITKNKRYEYDDAAKKLSVTEIGDSASHRKITSHPQGDLKKLQGILNEAREGLENVEVLRVKFSKPLEMQRPNSSLSADGSHKLSSGKAGPDRKVH